MKCKAIKAFSGPRWGNVSIGDTVNLDVNLARQLREAGLIDEVEIDAMGKQIPSSLLQAAQVSQKGNAITSQGLKKVVDAKSLESTQAIKQSHATSSMDAIEDGGKSITAKPKKTRKSGRKTSGQRKNSK